MFFCAFGTVARLASAQLHQHVARARQRGQARHERVERGSDAKDVHCGSVAVALEDLRRGVEGGAMEANVGHRNLLLPNDARRNEWSAGGRKEEET